MLTANAIIDHRIVNGNTVSQAKLHDVATLIPKQLLHWMKGLFRSNVTDASPITGTEMSH